MNKMFIFFFVLCLACAGQNKNKLKTYKKKEEKGGGLYEANTKLLLTVDQNYLQVYRG